MIICGGKLFISMGQFFGIVFDIQIRNESETLINLRKWIKILFDFLLEFRKVERMASYKSLLVSQKN